MDFKQKETDVFREWMLLPWKQDAVNAGVAVSVWDEVNFKIKRAADLESGRCKGASIRQKGIIRKVVGPSNRASKYTKHKWHSWKEKPTISQS